MSNKFNEYDFDECEEEFEQRMVSKIDKGEKLEEGEIREIIDYAVDEIEGEENRWTRDISSIVELDCRLFKVDWRRGLTECQENEFPYQPYEVIKKQRKKTITVTEYVPVNKGK